MSTDSAAYEAGLRAGYAHGYDIGRAHGRAQAEADLEIVDAGALPAPRLSGPTREELIARGNIPIDHTRPPALPARLWDAQDWAKAGRRDLPTTKAGHAQWQEAIAAGRVPTHLADAYAGANPTNEGRAAVPRPAAELAEDVARAVADTNRVLAALRTRLDPARPPEAPREEQPGSGRTNSADAAEVAPRERGIGR